MRSGALTRPLLRCPGFGSGGGADMPENLNLSRPDHPPSQQALPSSLEASLGENASAEDVSADGKPAGRVSAFAGTGPGGTAKRPRQAFSLPTSVWSRYFGGASARAGSEIDGESEGGTGSAHFQQYEDHAPHAQHMINLYDGWTSSFPPEAGVVAGTLALYADTRIAWALEQFGSLEGRSVMEIGPLEGMHSYMLETYAGRPARLDCVEANRRCFQRCLVTKEVLGMQTARFHLGDASLWLDESEVNYDLVVGSGVLYHMREPGEFLERVARRARALFLWTHVFDEAAMPKGDVRRTPFLADDDKVGREVAGAFVRYHRRAYHKANTLSSFCGGMDDLHHWISRDDLLALIGRLGFGTVRTAFEEPDHPGGPALAIYASRD